MSTMELGKRVQADVRASDATEVVNNVLSWRQSPEPHKAEILVRSAERAAENAGYNGWKNYETWCMALWIDNDQGTYEESREMARRVLENHDPAAGYGVTPTLADELKGWMDDQRPEEVAGASVWTDLLGAAFSEVDWYEIAENYIEEVNAE